MLIDLQGDYLSEPGIEPSVGSILDRTRLLLRQCRERGIPVAHVWTTVTRSPDNRMRHWKSSNRWKCEAGTDGHAPPAAIAPREHELTVAKCSFSAFAGTDALSLLRERRVDTLLLTGVHLHACVRQTAIDACQAGFDVWIAADAVGSDDPIHAAITRRYLEARSIEFISAECMLRRLGQGDVSLGCAGSGDAVSAAVAAADEAAASWRFTERSYRRQLALQFQKQAESRSDRWADLITSGIGKPVRFSRTEVGRTLQMIDAIVQRDLNATDGNSSNAIALRRLPHGVVGVITPYNNPVYIPLGKIIPAVLHGNSVVWKPAPEAHRVATDLVEAMADAGWPRGLVSLVEGGRREGEAVLADARIKAVTITGSLAAGSSAQEACSRRRIPLQAELGGNNAAIVWPDADLGLAAREIAAAAFAMAGQRCTANRRVIVHEECRVRFLNMLVEATQALSWGDPRLETVDIGPLVSPERCRQVGAAVERATADLGSPLFPLGVQPPTCHEFAGAWHPPTIIACDDPSHEIVQEETFGPVLVVQTTSDWDHAINLCNGVRQGLAAAIFTCSRQRVDDFLAEAQAGILKINRSTADADVDVPFGGWKASGIGPPEHGAFDVEFYTRPQIVYGSLSEGR